MPMYYVQPLKRLYPLGSRCEPCARSGAKRREQRRKYTRPSAWTRGYKTLYRKARAAIPADNPVCSICYSRPAATVDHNVPLSRGNRTA